MEAAERIHDPAVGAAHQGENASGRQSLPDAFRNDACRQEFGNCSVARDAQVGICDEKLAIQGRARIADAKYLWERFNRHARDSGKQAEGGDQPCVIQNTFQ